VDRIRHRRLRFESAFAFSGEAARFQPKSIESHEIEDSPDWDRGCGKRVSLSQTGIPNACPANWASSTKQHPVDESREHHGQTTVLWRKRHKPRPAMIRPASTPHSSLRLPARVQPLDGGRSCHILGLGKFSPTAPSGSADSCSPLMWG
jgi:hypothetical protein